MLGHAVPITATPPPPLQIKIVPASIQDKGSAQIILPNTQATTTSAQSIQVVNSAAASDVPVNDDDDDVTEVLDSDEVNFSDSEPFLLFVLSHKVQKHRNSCAEFAS